MRSLCCGIFLVALTVLATPRPGAGEEDFKVEPGFTLLFNGKDLTGWKMKKGGDSLDGKTEAAKGRFKVKDGILVIDPKVGGDIIIETAKPLTKDVHIKFDYLPDEKCNNDLFILGVKFDIKKGDVKNIKEGEWNRFEIVAKDGKVEFRNNGEVQRSNPTKAEKSSLGVRAEIGGIQIRRMRAKDAP